MPLLAFVLILLLAAPPPAAAGWRRPVPGEVVRPFDYRPAAPFAAGRHRGADLAAPPGAGVVSACAGRVAFAGVVPRHGRTVTVRCGRWRVTYAPLARVWVRKGSRVTPGARLGTLGSGHGGALHLGARRAGDPFGYVDPVARFGGIEVPPVAVRVPRVGPRPAVRPPRVPLPRPAPVAVRPVAAPSPQVAPWPVWLGLALLLCGAAGGTTLRRRRRSAMARGRAVAPVA